MATILLKKRDTTGAPSAGDLTNSSGGAEVAVNTADKRIYAKNSGGNVVEIGTAPSEIKLTDYSVTGSAIGNVGSTREFSLASANFFNATLDQNSTFTFSNAPTSGDFGTFVLELTNGGAFTITWPTSVDWVGGTAPTLTASGKDQLVFTTRDAGTTWFGFVAGLDIK